MIMRASEALEASLKFKNRCNFNDTIYQNLLNSIELEIKAAIIYGNTSINLEFNDLFLNLEKSKDVNTMLAMQKDHAGGFNHNELRNYQEKILDEIKLAGYNITCTETFVLQRFCVDWGD